MKRSEDFLKLKVKNMNKHEKFQKLEDELNKFFKERNELIHGTLLAILSRQHVFAVGPPGTAKSMIIRQISDQVKNGNYWEKLFTRYTVPDEVFGPVKLSKLKKDKFERRIDGSLPTANFAFIDEVFKANSSILNSLLTILNERIYHNDGQAVDVPLETMMSASNEIPDDRDELGALWDRFLLKYRVKDVQQSSKFKNVIGTQEDPSISVELTLDEIHKAQEEVKNVEIPDAVLDQVVETREQLLSEGIRPSTRRYREAMGVVRAEAWFNGRDTATVDDLYVLCHILWDDIDHISITREKVTETTNSDLRDAIELIDGIRDAWKHVKKAEEGSQEETNRASEALSKINKSIKELRNIKKDMEREDRSTDKVEEYIDEAEDIVENKIVDGIMKAGLD